jgi:hypothetical protein
MNFLGFLASGWIAWVAFLIAIVVIFVIIWRLMEGGLISAGIMAVVEIFLIWVFIFGNTHRVVPLNHKGVVIDRTVGNIIGATRNSGLTNVPFFGSTLYLFPSASNQQVCYDFTPSVKGGYEVKMNVCFYIDMSKMNWVKQIERYNQYDYNNLVKVWIAQVSPKVAESIKEFMPADLTGQRAKVSQTILHATEEWFDSENMKLNNVAVANWNFTNPAVSQAYDQTVIAQTAQMRAQAELDAAKTKLEAIQTMAEGQSVALKKLGIVGENATVQWLYLQYLQGLNATPIVVVNSGSGNSSPIVGVNTEGQPLPTAEPKK